MFELLLLAMVLATLIVLLLSGAHVLRRHPARAARLLKGYAVALAAYFGCLVVVSLASPQRVVAMKEDRCFDDWCVAVDAVTRHDGLGEGTGTAKPDGVFFVVTLRLSNQGRGRSQRASSAAVHLLDRRGRRYDVSATGQAALAAQRGDIPALTSMIEVGHPLVTYQVFDLPREARGIELIIEHPVGFSPGLLVIGDEGALFHKPTIVRLLTATDGMSSGPVRLRMAQTRIAAHRGLRGPAAGGTGCMIGNSAAISY
jgi:hypothetical protein